MGASLIVLGGSIAALVGASPPVSQSAVAQAQPPLASRAVSKGFQARMVGGFRMEGAPEVEVVFGDTRAYRGRIDRFFALDKAMKKQRLEFSRRVQAGVAALVATQRGCPADELAPQYWLAHQAAEEYRRLGIQFEIEYTAIQTLHRFGESQGLTPDYRWLVNKIKPAYREALTDYKEMQVALVDQLDRELRYRGCKPSTLLTMGAGKSSTPALAYQAPVPEPRRRRWRREEPKQVVPAKTVTFFIDNRTCDEALDVYADGALLGEVPPRKRAAFQTLAGNHVICLIGAGDERQCGQVGTVRTAYIHDSWAMTRQCRD